MRAACGFVLGLAGRVVARRALVLVCLVCVGALGTGAASAATLYRAIALGSSTSRALAVSNRGEIVGSGGASAAFSYSRVRGIVDLGVLPGWTSSDAFAVNDRGEVVGSVFREVPSEILAHAFGYTPARGMFDLGTLPGAFQTEALGVNDRGEIVGQSVGGSGDEAFSYTPRGRIVGLFPGRALAVNDRGEIVGDSTNGAVSYTRASGVVDLGILPGWRSSRANAINEHGEIVGVSSTLQFGDAFVYTPSRGMVDLAQPAWSYSEATGVNDHGQIVGSEETGGDNAPFRAFTYTPRGRLIILPLPPGASYSKAFGINDRGEIVGESDGGGAILWKPVKRPTRG